MGRIIEDLLCGAVGYGIGKNISNKDVKVIIDNYLKNVSFDNLMRDYSQFHNDVRMDSSTGFRSETIEEKCQYGMDMHYF